MILTNGVQWRIYHVEFTKPINQELLIDIDFCSLNLRNASDMESLFLLTKEGWIKSALGDYQTQKQALSRFFLGALLQTDAVLDVIRRDLRRVSPDVRIESEQIREVLINEVIKREVLDGEQAETAKKKISRAAKKPLRQAPKDEKDEKDEKPQPELAIADTNGDERGNG